VVIEVVSGDAASRARDYEDKRHDYAAAGIPEYWIVDPADRRIVVLRLEGEAYVVDGEFGADERATSVVLAGFSLDVADLLRAGAE
jgi:Uma2 family endonuclease